MVQIVMRIMAYVENSRYQCDDDNPIVRMADDACVSGDQIVDIEEITFEMIG